MPKTYSAGDVVLATEINEVFKTSGLYTADQQASDAYVLTTNPTVSVLSHGDVFRFRANTANTGACTANVSGTGAIAIKKNVTMDLETGDIKAGQMVEIQYDGTFYQLISRSSQTVLRAHGSVTRAGSTASGSQTIAHGLGRTPTFVRINASVGFNNVSGFYGLSYSDGSYNGSTTQLQYVLYWGGAGAVGGVDTTNIIYLYFGNTAGSQVATISVDATNITLTWTKSGTTSGDNMSIHWEAFVDA